VRTALLSFSSLLLAAAFGCSDGASSADPTGSSSPGSGASGGGSPGAGGGADGGASAAGGAAPLRERYALDAEFPEGGAYDAASKRFFVGDLVYGTIHVTDGATGESTLYFVEQASGTWRTLGMAVDEQRRRLWVCAIDDPDSPGLAPYAGFVWLFDLDTDERAAVFSLADAAPDGSCNDVAVAPNGAVYVTDRELPNVYRVDADGGASLFASDPLLEPLLLGQNGIVVLPDASAVLTTTYLPPGLNRVSLPDGAVTAVDIDGDFFDATPGAGADGMALAGGDAYVAFSSELVRVSPTLGDWSSVTAAPAEVVDGTTDVIATPDGLYLLNGQATRFVLGQEPDAPFALVRFTGTFD
jgi:sugar lactone lactonase YvrE